MKTGTTTDSDDGRPRPAADRRLPTSSCPDCSTTRYSKGGRLLGSGSAKQPTLSFSERETKGGDWPKASGCLSFACIAQLAELEDTFLQKCRWTSPRSTVIRLRRRLRHRQQTFSRANSIGEARDKVASASQFGEQTLRRAECSPMNAKSHAVRAPIITAAKSRYARRFHPDRRPRCWFTCRALESSYRFCPLDNVLSLWAHEAPSLDPAEWNSHSALGKAVLSGFPQRSATSRILQGPTLSHLVCEGPCAYRMPVGVARFPSLIGA